MFAADLHPRAPAGSANGGQFAAGGGSSAAPASPATAPRKPAAPKAKGKAKGKPTAGYTPKQWARLQALEVKAHSGGKLTPAQQHALHVAHEKHLAHLKATAAPAKPKAAVTVAAKPKAKAPAKPKVASAKPAPKVKTVTGLATGSRL